MALSSRPSRAPRTSGGQFAGKSNQLQHPAPVRLVRNLNHTSDPSVLGGDADHDTFDHHGPPPKKRRIDVLPHRQSTLDHHFVTAQSGNTKPPTKVTVAQPHGQLLETLNGVRTVLDVREDELHSTVLPVSPVQKLPQPVVPTRAGSLAKKEDKRLLRSQDEGPKLKSELATYFPDYEDVVFGVEREDGFVTVDTAFYVTDNADGHHDSPSHSSSLRSKDASLRMRNGVVNGYPVPTTPQQIPSHEMNGCSIIDLSQLAPEPPSPTSDPLSDAHFFKSHRRAERKEKQLRNIERERAMHEKVQLERLLDRLQGHEWLKVLGITGITDGEAKRYEPKRDYFIGEVQALVDKFKVWKEAEKRQKLEREEAKAREAESEERDDTEEGSVEPMSSEAHAGAAARQLLQETTNTVRSGFKIRLSTKGRGPPSTPGLPTSAPRPSSMPPPSVFVPPSPESEFTSFYAKRHLRDAALGKARHGRSVTAFGHAIPELEEREFVLPADYVTADTLRANARERRRLKRGAVADANASS